MGSFPMKNQKAAFQRLFIGFTMGFFHGLNDQVGFVGV